MSQLPGTTYIDLRAVVYCQFPKLGYRLSVSILVVLPGNLTTFCCCQAYLPILQGTLTSPCNFTAYIILYEPDCGITYVLICTT